MRISVFRYPLKAVKVMHTVALRTESSLYNPTTSPSLVASAQVWYGQVLLDPGSFSLHICHMVVSALFNVHCSVTASWLL